MTRLGPDEVSERLSALPGWRVEEAELARDFRFDDYMGGVRFVNAVAGAAEAAGHHPDLFVTWGRVTVRLTTHSAGGLTAKDFELASRIDAL